MLKGNQYNRLKPMSMWKSHLILILMDRGYPGYSVTKDELLAISLEWVIHLQTSCFSSRPAVVHCMLMTVRSSGPPHEGRLPFPRNLSLQITSDGKEFGTTGQGIPRATSWHRNEFHLINNDNVINLQTSCFSSQLLPAQRWFIARSMVAASLVKVSTLCLII